jgi:hypothetical protein
MTEIEQTAKSLMPRDGANAIIGGRRRRLRDESIGEALVIALEVIVLDPSPCRPSENQRSRRSFHVGRDSTKRSDLIRSPRTASSGNTARSCSLPTHLRLQRAERESRRA